MGIEMLISGVVFGIWFVDRLVAQARADRGIVAREFERAARDAALASKVPTIDGTR